MINSINSGLLTYTDTTITDSEIRYNEFSNYFLIGPKWASVDFRLKSKV